MGCPIAYHSNTNESFKMTHCVQAHEPASSLHAVSGRLLATHAQLSVAATIEHRLIIKAQEVS